MTDWLASGAIVDLILLGLALEVIALAAYRHYRGRGPRHGELAATAVAGACLLLALRSALTDAGWPWIAGWLLLGLAGHITDLSLRWSADRR